MLTRQPLELADVDRAVATLLRTYPEAAVGAVREDGCLVAPPPSLRLGSHQVFHADPPRPGHTALPIVVEEHRSRVTDAWDEVFRAGTAETTVELASGVPAELHLVDARPRHGVLLAVLVADDLDSVLDPRLSELLAAHEALRTREQLLRRLTETLPSGVVQIDRSGRIVYKNDRTAELVGNPGATTLTDQLAWCTADDASRVAVTIDAVLTFAEDGDIEVTIDAPGRPAARVCHVALRALTTDTGHVTGAICSIYDVTQASVLRNELTVRATVDALTGCQNRASIMATLHASMSGELDGPPPGGQQGTAVIFVDLDRFKGVNDRHGHAMGDRLLAVAADRLRSATRARDVVGRVGGDEFLVVCPDMASPADALQTAQRITDSLREPVEHEGLTIATSASVGIAWTDEPDRSPASLVADADAAMYRAKRGGVSA